MVQYSIIADTIHEIHGWPIPREQRVAGTYENKISTTNPQIKEHGSIIQHPSHVYQAPSIESTCIYGPITSPRTSSLYNRVNTRIYSPAGINHMSGNTTTTKESKNWFNSSRRAGKWLTQQLSPAITSTTSHNENAVSLITPISVTNEIVYDEFITSNDSLLVQRHDKDALITTKIWKPLLPVKTKTTITKPTNDNMDKKERLVTSPSPFGSMLTWAEVAASPPTSPKLNRNQNHIKSVSHPIVPPNTKPKNSSWILYQSLPVISGNNNNNNQIINNDDDKDITYYIQYESELGNQNEAQVLSVIQKLILSGKNNMNINNAWYMLYSMAHSHRIHAISRPIPNKSILADIITNKLMKQTYQLGITLILTAFTMAICVATLLSQTHYPLVLVYTSTDVLV